MGSCSYNITCWKCGNEEMNVSSDNGRPYGSGECLDCGFTFYTKEDQMDLEEVNERRLDYDLQPISKLKEQEDN